MITLLFVVLVCGVVAWVVYASPMPDFFKTGAIGILMIIVLIAVFRVLLGVNVGIPLR